MLRLIASAGQLTPDVRLGQALSEFGAALEGEQKSTFDELRRRNRALQQSDVSKLCEDINAGIRSSSKTGGGRHKPFGSWIQTALTTLQSIASAGDVLVGGSQNLIACGVWAAVRTTLLFSVTYVSLFEKVAEVLMRVGRSASMHQTLVELFGSREPILRDMVCEYLIVMTELCCSLVNYRKKAGMVRVMASLDMGKSLQGFEDRLNVWATLINEQVQVLQSQLSVEMSSKLSLTQKSQRLFYRSQDQERERWHCWELVRHLSGHQEDFDRAWRRQLRKGTVRWIFDTPEFISWGKLLLSTNVLFITGGLGMGKSVVMANIVSRLLQSDPVGVSYFFVERSSRGFIDGEAVLRSIAHQLVKSILEASLRNNVALPSNFTMSRASLEILELGDLISTAVSHRQKLGLWRTYIVLDGLDQLQDSEIFDILATLRNCAQLNNRVGELRICISMRSGSMLQTMLQEHFSAFIINTLGISSPRSSAELKEFVKEELHDRPGFRELSQTTQFQIQDSLWSLADGMYLWASLQVDHLFPRFSRKTLSEQDIIGLLENLPRPLSDLFDSAISTIIDSKNQPTIFQLVIGAKRRLSLSELLVAVSVPQRSSDWNENLIPFCHDPATFVYECSGGLLELDIEDQTVYFVHSSVYFHLTDSEKDWSQVLQASSSLAGLTTAWETSAEASDLRWAKTCLTYLDLSIHQRQLTSFSSEVEVSSSQALAKVQKSLGEQSTLMKYAGRIMRTSQVSRTPVSVDLARVAKQYLEDQKRLHIKVEPKVLLGYAKSHWLEHSDHFLFDVKDESMNDSLARPFWKVLCSNCAAEIELPFSKHAVSQGIVMAEDVHGNPATKSLAAFADELVSLDSAVKWSIQHEHMRLFWVLFEILDLKIMYQPRYDIVKMTVMKIFKRESYHTDSELRHGIPVKWERNPSAIKILGFPFLCSCVRDKGSEELVLDVDAIIQACIRGIQSGMIGTRDVVQAHMWECFQNPLLQDLPRWKHIIGCIGSFYNTASTTVTADRSPTTFDPLSSRRLRLASWVTQESMRGSRAMSNIDCDLVINGLLAMSLSPAFPYFVPMFLRSWEEGQFTTHYTKFIALGMATNLTMLPLGGDLARILAEANAPCHLRDPEGFTPLWLRLQMDQRSTGYNTLPQSWITCEGCLWSAHRPGTAGQALEVLSHSSSIYAPRKGVRKKHKGVRTEDVADLIRRRAMNGVVTNRDVFGHSKKRISLPGMMGHTGVVRTLVESMNRTKEQVLCVHGRDKDSIELVVYEAATAEERLRAVHWDSPESR